MQDTSLELEPALAPELNRISISRAIYFFYFAGAAYLTPYIALYLQSIQLTGSQIGVLMAVSPIVSLFASPAWGALADSTRQHKRVLLFCVATSVASVILISLATSFLGLLFCIALFALFSAPIMPLVDNSVVEQLGPRRSEYGKQRVWGSYGWGVAGLTSGWVVARLQLPVIFYVFAACLAVCFFLVLAFPVSRASIGVRLGKDFKKLFSSQRWILFLAVTWVAGAGMAMLSNYYFIYLKEINTPDQLLGIALAIGILSEIPFMLYSDRLLRRFGPVGLLVIGSLVVVFRGFAFSFAVYPWQALALQLLQGPTFAIIWVAGVEYASQIAPPGLGATAQGIFGGVMFGLGFSTGSLLGGILYQTLGIRPMYRVAATGVLLAVLLFMLISRERKARMSGLSQGP